MPLHDRSDSADRAGLLHRRRILGLCPLDYRSLLELWRVYGSFLTVRTIICTQPDQGFFQLLQWLIESNHATRCCLAPFDFLPHPCKTSRVPELGVSSGRYCDFHIDMYILRCNIFVGPSSSTTSHQTNFILIVLTCFTPN